MPEPTILINLPPMSDPTGYNFAYSNQEEMYKKAVRLWTETTDKLIAAMIEVATKGRQK